jgi:hypothetical protein
MNLTRVSLLEQKLLHVSRHQEKLIETKSSGISKLLSGKTNRNHKLWNIESTVTYISHTYYKVIQWYNNVIIIKTEANLPQA